MKPVIGVSCSTLVFDDLPGLLRQVVPDQYLSCTTAAGGLPVVLPNVDAVLAESYLEGVEGLVLTGGCDIAPLRYGAEPEPKLGTVDEVRDLFEIALARCAHENGLPILAICRGAQVLNVALGGSLFQDVPTQVEGGLKHYQKTVRWEELHHGLEIVEGTRLRALAGVGRTQVNSFHHQAVDRVGEGLVVSAYAPDGVVEGLEDPAHPYCVAVQWHPERRAHDPLTQALFGSFLDAVRSRSPAERV